MTKKSLKPKQNESTRPPVVVVLGHVDHGKTTLLDAIRKTEVAASEYGGITQGIGAYQVEVDGGKITFIDTPGHEAFSKMRSRGASAADIAVLVVAANDSVMPQTIESIKIIKEAKIPFLVAINKVDLPEANVDKVIKDLGRYEVQLETYGGDVPFVKISAKKGEGIKELLDLIKLLADMTGIKGSADEALEGVVIESRLDKNRGALATVVVKNGTLKVTQEIFVDGVKTKVRALINYQGEQIAEAGPGTPAEIFGLTALPPVGAKVGLTLEAAMPEAKREGPASNAQGNLPILLKADTLGSLEAITNLLPKNVQLLSSGTGEISEADILLARSTSAIILGFNAKENAAAKKLAETEKVLVRTYKIIYELLEELADAAAGLLEPVVEEIRGRGQIIAEFPFEKLRVAGVKVLEGRVARGDQVKVTRGEELVGQARIKSLRVGKEETTKVEVGRECGALLEPQVDFRVGDDIISHSND